VQILEASSNGEPVASFAVHDTKTGLYKRGQKQLVTGLILTPDGKVSIGRERKRLISAGVHRIKRGFEEEGHVQNIKGWLAFANSVEPEFVQRLERKYGAIVREVLRRAVIRRPPPPPPLSSLPTPRREEPE
jgi:RNA-directed DNA polymerase